MSFGDDSTPQMVPPSVPASTPPAPSFTANAATRSVQRGKPYGGTLLTSPIGVTGQSSVARPSLVTS